MFGSIINAVEAVVKGIRKVPVATLIVDLIGYIPSIIRSIEQMLAMKKDGFSKDEIKVMLDDALLTFDLKTGVEGVTLISNMPKEKEEETLDCLAKVIRNLAYNKLGIEGYVKNETE